MKAVSITTSLERTRDSACVRKCIDTLANIIGQLLSIELSGESATRVNKVTRLIQDRNRRELYKLLGYVHNRAEILDYLFSATQCVHAMVDLFFGFRESFVFRQIETLKNKTAPIISQLANSE